MKKPMDSDGLWTSVDSLALRARRRSAPATPDHPCPQSLDCSRASLRSPNDQPTLTTGMMMDCTPLEVSTWNEKCHLCARSKVLPMSRVAHIRRLKARPLQQRRDIGSARRAGQGD